MASNASSPLTAVKSLVENIVPWQTWLEEQKAKAAKVALCRKYADGEHRASLTKEMREMLRIAEAEVGSPFNINHLDNIIQSVADRLEVTEITSSETSSTGTEWLAAQLSRNNFDALQSEVQEAALRDGETFVMVDWPSDEELEDGEEGYARLTLEEAFDGVSGIVMVYGNNKRRPELALKFWQEVLPGEKKSSTRVNAYYADHVDKYTAKGSSNLIAFGNEEPPWTNSGKPIGIPLIHFKNRRSKSEIESAIPIQDAINRTMVSMVMASELTAFMIRYAIGIKPPRGLSPGMWLEAFISDDKTGVLKTPTEEQRKWLDSIRFGKLDQGELAPFLAQAEFMIDQMYTITRTPRHNASTDASGESLKQKEIGLVGKVKRAQVSFGNSWEWVVRLMDVVTQAFGKGAPKVSAWSTKWRSAELRDDSAVVDNALKVADRIDERTFLSEVASVFGWSTADIDNILKAKQQEQVNKFAAMAGSLPNFSGRSVSGLRTTETSSQSELETQAS